MARPRSSIARDFALDALAGVATLAAIGGIVIAAALVAPARAHDAPSGWSYAPSCCSGMDCAPIDAAAVIATPQGWRVTIAPGAHPQVPPFAAPLTHVVPFDDVRIRQSGDEHFHPCIHPISRAMLCLYVPDHGV